MITIAPHLDKIQWMDAKFDITCIKE